MTPRHTFGPSLSRGPGRRVPDLLGWSVEEAEAMRSRTAIRWTCCTHIVGTIILGEHADGEPAACIDEDVEVMPDRWPWVETKQYERPGDGELAETMRMVCGVCGSDTRLSADRALSLLQTVAAAGRRSVRLSVRLVSETRRGETSRRT